MSAWYPTSFWILPRGQHGYIDAIILHPFLNISHLHVASLGFDGQLLIFSPARTRLAVTPRTMQCWMFQQHHCRDHIAKCFCNEQYGMEPSSIIWFSRHSCWVWMYYLDRCSIQVYIAKLLVRYTFVIEVQLHHPCPSNCQHGLRYMYTMYFFYYAIPSWNFALCFLSCEGAGTQTNQGLIEPCKLAQLDKPFVQLRPYQFDVLFHEYGDTIFCPFDS